MWLSSQSFWFVHNYYYSLKICLFPCSQSHKLTKFHLLKHSRLVIPKPSGLFVWNTCCLPPTQSISCLASHFVVFGHWKITTSCLENTQNTVTSLSAGLSKFHQQPLPQRVNVGGAARFECQIEGVPTPVITWEKDKAAVPQEARWGLGFPAFESVKWSQPVKEPCLLNSVYSPEAEAPRKARCRPCNPFWIEQEWKEKWEGILEAVPSGSSPACETSMGVKNNSVWQHFMLSISSLCNVQSYVYVIMPAMIFVHPLIIYTCSLLHSGGLLEHIPAIRGVP